MNENNFVNEFKATGRIIKVKPFNNNSKLVTLFIKGSNNREIYPQFVCNNSILPKKLTHHMYLTICGYVGNTPLKDKGTGSIIFRQRFIASSIEPAKTLTELKFGEKGKFFPESEITVYIKGKVTIINENKNWYEYHINVGKKSVTVGMKQLERHLPVKVGDTICCVCKVSTIEKGDGDDRKRFENIQITDMAVIRE